MCKVNLILSIQVLFFHVPYPLGRDKEDKIIFGLEYLARKQNFFNCNQPVYTDNFFLIKGLVSKSPCQMA